MNLIMTTNMIRYWESYMNEWIWVLAIAGFVFSLFASILSFFALAYIIGMKNSTHRIEYVPANQGGENSEEVNKLMEQDIFKDML